MSYLLDSKILVIFCTCSKVELLTWLQTQKLRFPYCILKFCPTVDCIILTSTCMFDLRIWANTYLALNYFWYFLYTFSDLLLPVQFMCFYFHFPYESRQSSAISLLISKISIRLPWMSNQYFFKTSRFQSKKWWKKYKK